MDVSARRYRYVGLERDDETGLYAMGARYYAAWLGRWTSADPLGVGADGPGVYNYTRGSPVVLVDPGGMESSTEKQIGQMTDAQLIGHLKSLNPEQRGAFLSDTSGRYATRANAAAAGLERVYTTPAVQIQGEVESVDVNSLVAMSLEKLAQQAPTEGPKTEETGFLRYDYNLLEYLEVNSELNSKLREEAYDDPLVLAYVGELDQKQQDRLQANIAFSVMMDLWASAAFNPEAPGAITATRVLGAGQGSSTGVGAPLTRAGKGPQGAGNSPAPSIVAGGGAAANQLGTAREATVAKLVGGKVASGNKVVLKGVGSTDIDVIGPKGELIMVGGPKKAADLGALGRVAKIYKGLADERGVPAQAYLTSDTPDEVFEFLAKRLGRENVFRFD